MRFGIMAMQLNALIPADTSLEQVMAHVMGLNHANLVRQIAGDRFRLVELGGDLALFFPQVYSPPAIEGLAALKAELGLTYTVHLPLWSVEPSTPLAPVRQGSTQAAIDCVKATLPLEPESYVLHATGALAAEFYRMRLPELARGLILQQFKDHARDSIQTILAETGLPSRKLAIETIEFPFELTLQLAEQLDLSVCFDTGHVNVGFSGSVDLFDALEKCLPRLGEVHLHDALRPGQTARLRQRSPGARQRRPGRGPLARPLAGRRLERPDHFRARCRRGAGLAGNRARSSTESSFRLIHPPERRSLWESGYPSSVCLPSRRWGWP